MDKITRVAVWGTFDLLHEGHINFLKEAARLGDLYVIIMTDKITKKNKGYIPNHNEQYRKKIILNIPYVKNCYIDSIDKGLKSILHIRPDIFCFGYDQKTIWEKKLMVLANNYRLKIRFRRLYKYANGIHSSDIRKKLAA